MIRRFWKAGALLGLLLVGLTAAANNHGLLDALLQRPHTQDGTRVVPDASLRRWDPITIFYTADKVPQAGPEDHPERFVERLPKQPGAWTWLDRKTLQFRPAEPWAPLSLVSVGVDRRTYDLFTLAMPASSTTPRAGQRGLDPVDTIQLSFTDPVPVESLARLTTIELRPLPGLSDDGLVVLDQDDFEVKTLQRADADAPAAYALVLTEPIPRGTEARVKVRLSLDSEAREAVWALVFSTSEPFRVTELACGSASVPLAPSGSQYAADQPLACSNERFLQLRFNAHPAGLDAIAGRNLLRFEPAVANLDFQTEGRTLTVRGDFRDGIRYRIDVQPTPIQDTAGRALEMKGPSVAHLRFVERPAYFEWQAGDGILERLGPHRVPIAGRRVGQVDLRVYEVDPLNRELWPFSNTPIEVDETLRPPGPGEEPAALAETGTVTTPELRRRLTALGSPGYAKLVDVGLEGGAAQSGLDLTEAIVRLAGVDGAGHFLVGARRVDGQASRSWMRVQVTDLSLTTLETGDQVTFVVTSLSTGAPVPGARIQVDGVNGKAWERLIAGTTDGSGRYTWKAPGAGTASVRRLVVSKGPDTLVLDASRPPESFVDGRWRRDSSKWLQWAWNSLDARVEKPRIRAHLFSERPLYRPEEEVHLKGYVRTRFQGELTRVQGSGKVTVSAPGGARWQLPVKLSPSGAFYVVWDEKDVPTGRYEVAYQHQDGQVYATTDFQVEAYRLPTFELELSTPENVDTVPNDGPFEVRATASYYAGGKVALRPIEWRVTQYPYTWTPQTPGLEGFFFSSDGRFSRAGRFDSTPALQRTAQTDRAGSAVMTLDPGIEPTSQPRTYVLEAKVTGADEQTVSATYRVNAVPAFVLGLNVPRTLEKAVSIPVQAVALDPQGGFLADQEVTVRLIQRQWHSVLQASDFSDGVARYVTDTVDVPLEERTLKTRAGVTSLELPIVEAGVYLVELESRDALGRVQVVSIDLFAGGKGQVSWSKAEAGVFDVTADAPSYRPGDTAKLVIRSPFQTGEALVVVEAPTGNQLQAVAIVGGKATVPVKIREGWVPSIPVHVLLRRGRVASAGVVGGTDLGKPETLGSTRWLTIEPDENTVEVKLVHAERAMPGEKVDVTIELKDPSGKPLAGEVTLWLVDQAVLALAQEKRLDPRPDFLPARVSRFSAHDTRNLAFGRLPFSEMPGGDGGAEEEGEGALDEVAVRKNFKAVPYYEPAIQVGATGTRTVSVQLPDNLTVFKLRAKVSSGEERFGHAKSSIRVRLPVLLQADLPRFLRPGDQLELAALGRVIEGPAGAGNAEIRVEGLELLGGATQRLEWSADEAVRLAWGVRVPTPPPGADGALAVDQVTVTIGAKRTADGAGDAVQVTLPLLDDRRPRLERQVITVAKGGSVQLDALEEPARDGSLRRRAVLSDHPGLVKMALAMDVFVQRPARSSGMQIDRARAWIGLGETRKALGLDGDDLVNAAVAEALAWLPGVLDSRGLVAAWPGGRGQVGLTADALLLLIDAAEAGYPVDAKLQAGLVRTLQGSLRSDYRFFLDGASWLERSQALEALASAGEFAPAYFTELGDNSRQLGPRGVATILLAADRAGKGGEPLARSLTGQLESEIVLALFEGEERYQGLQSEGSVTSRLISNSEAQTLATVTRSLGRAAPNAAKLPYAVDALVRLGGEDGWGGRADAPALLALSERLKGRASEKVGVRLGSLQLTTEQGLASGSLETSGAVAVQHTAGPQGVVLVTSRYIPAASGSQAEARNQGFVVSREAALYLDGATPSRTTLDEAGRELRVPLGTVIEEHVRLVNPEDRTYLVLDVPLAAGVELMNPDLQTSGSDAQPSRADTVEATWFSRGDASMTYAFEQLPKGTYDFYFRTRATTRGTFVQPPAVGEALYDASIVGSSPGATVIVE